MTLPQWPPRDWRKLLAMLLLSGGGMAITVFAWRVTTLVAARSMGDPWPLAYALFGLIASLDLVLISLGWVIGRTSVSGSIGAASFTSSGGEDEGEPLTSGDTVTLEKADG